MLLEQKFNLHVMLNALPCSTHFLTPCLMHFLPHYHSQADAA
jgi:hypothetical protein